MQNKPSYEELEIRVQKLEKALAEKETVSNELEKDRTWFKSLYEKAPLGYQSLDRNGNFLEVNKAWLDLLGYSREEVIGKSFGDFLHPEWRDHFKKNFPRFKAVGEVLGVEFEIARKDGTYILVSFNGKIGKNIEGDFLQTHCIFRNITEEKKVEEQLKSSEERYRLLFDESINPIAIYNQSAEFVMINQIGADNLSLPVNEIIGKPLSHFLPEMHDLTVRRIAETLEGNKGLHFEDEILINGQKRNFLSIFQPVHGLTHDSDTVQVISYDITDLKIAEKTLKFHSQLLNAVEQSVIATDLQGHIIYWNTFAEKLYGWTHKEALGKTTIELIANESYVDQGAKIMEELRQGRSWSGEYLCRHRNGTEIPIITTNSPIYDENGNLIGLIGVSFDLTERKRLEKESERERLLLQKAEQISNLGSWEWDIVTDRFEVSENWKRLHGIEKDSISSKELYTLAHPKDVTGIEALSQKVFQKKIPFYDHVHRIIRKNDGETRYVRALGEIVFDNDGKPIWMYGTTQDITESKKAEEALLQKHEMFERTEAIAHIGSWEWDIQSDRVQWSDELFRIFGREPSSGAPSYAEHPEIYVAEDMQRLHEAVKACVNQGKPYEIELRAIRTDGEIRHCIGRGRAQRDRSGKVFRLVGSHQDITERKRAEEEKEKLERQLQQAQKMESIGTLAGGIAHEFNNVLAIIMGNNELIMEELPQYSLAKESAEEIRIAGLRARDVVKQLLTFSIQGDSVKKAMDFKLVVQESMKLIRSTTPANIDIEQNLSADTYPVKGNDTQINQLLINLCNNAVDAMPEKGGKITVELSNETIEKQQTKFHSKLKPGQYTKLMVNDNGVGMDHETLERIFEPFFTTKDVGKGSGIGMAVVHGIVEGHGGSIIADSRPGQGTTFAIFFPAYEGEFEQISENQKELPTGEECILYVDDEASIAHLGKRRLESLGYRTESTTEPLKALEMVKSDPHRFDLVITDMAMPNMTGDQLIVEILKIRQDMPTIICTGYSAKISDKEANEMGVSSFAMKPLAKSDLATTVRKVLDAAKTSNLEKP